MRITGTVLLLLGLPITAMLLMSCDRLPPSGTSWSFTFKEVNGNATLDMDGVTIVFEGEQRSGSSSGNLQFSGIGSGRGQVGADDRAFTHQYSNGVNTMLFRKYHFRLLADGNRFSIQGTDVDLSQGKKVVTVKKDGSVKIEDI